MRATLTERDSFIWNDNDVELFVAGDDCYYELEINAFGTVYEAFFVWQDALQPGGRFDRPEFDPRGPNVDMLGGFQDASRFGQAPARPALRLPRLRPRLSAHGGAGGRSDQRPHHADRGWTVEMALPWTEPGRPVRRPRAPAARGRDPALRLLALRGPARPRQAPAREPRVEPQPPRRVRLAHPRELQRRALHGRPGRRVDPGCYPRDHGVACSPAPIQLRGLPRPRRGQQHQTRVPDGEIYAMAGGTTARRLGRRPAARCHPTPRRPLPCLQLGSPRSGASHRSDDLSRRHGGLRARSGRPRQLGDRHESPTRGRSPQPEHRSLRSR